jgi:hypothetical protein
MRYHTIVVKMKMADKPTTKLENTFKPLDNAKLIFKYVNNY